MSKIITPDNDSQKPAPQVPPVLAQQQFIELAGAVQRLREIENYSVLSPTLEAELRGTKEFITNTFVKYADEFLGCYHTVHSEYKPFLRALSTIANRVGAVLSQANQKQPAPANSRGETIEGKTNE